MTAATAAATANAKPSGPYYDPYDFEIDNDPYPVWKQLRDERPLYYNEKYDFFALSRYQDVERCLKDFKRYSSAKGTLLEIIKSGAEIPAGTIIFEDPPAHDIYRALMAPLFKPKTIALLETKVRQFCAQCLDPLVGKGGFDFVSDIGSGVPMRTIGMLLGIEENVQVAMREQIDAGLKIQEGAPPTAEAYAAMLRLRAETISACIEHRIKHPSDDIISEMLALEFVDATGTRRRLTRDELFGYINLLNAAGNETTTRLIGWAGKLLAENPDQRRLLVKNPALIGNAVEEVLRYEAPSPVQARYVTEDVEHHGSIVKAGNAILLVNGSANRDERQFPNADRFDVQRKTERHLAFGYGVHFCLGAGLARLEARVALEEILKRFPDWEVDWEHAVRAHTSTVRGWEKMPVKTA